jgi:hypothetical protein
MEEEIKSILRQLYELTYRRRGLELGIQQRLSVWTEGPSSLLNTFGKDNTYRASWQAVDSIIENADLALCLTSKHLYIRECKKWYEEKK